MGTGKATEREVNRGEKQLKSVGPAERKGKEKSS